LDDRRRLALVAGVLAFFIAFDVIQDLEGPVTGRAAVGVLAALLLGRLSREVRAAGMAA
jgi:hypothetical protein